MSAGLSALALLAVTMSGCDHGADARCFRPDVALPDRGATLGNARLGGSTCDLAAALFNRYLDRGAAARRPAASGGRGRTHHDMLAVAMANCDRLAVELLLRHGAPPDEIADDGGPLNSLPMTADPAFAHTLLSTRASTGCGAGMACPAADRPPG